MTTVVADSGHKTFAFFSGADFKHVTGSVSQFSSSASAHGAFTRVVDTTTHWRHGQDDWHRMVAVVGSESAGWTITIRSPDYAYRAVLVLFRRSAYIGSVRVFTFSVDRRGDTTGLARIIDHRIVNSH